MLKQMLEESNVEVCSRPSGTAPWSSGQVRGHEPPAAALTAVASWRHPNWNAKVIKVNTAISILLHSSYGGVLLPSHL